jgi:glycosyltransferase involved in cell wall biosynthesis
MDLVGEMLHESLQLDHADSFTATRLSPPLRRRLTKQRSEVRGQRSEGRVQTLEDEGRTAKREEIGRRFNADRFLNRFWDYPRFVRERKSEFDLFHVVDHSYGQLLHELPRERTIITCHDLDTFQCLLNPEQDRRSFLFRKMMERSLSGFQRAAIVTCDSAATRAELLMHGLIEAERTVVVSNGVHPSCSPESDPEADREATRLLGKPADDVFELLHVGSTIPRKRIDVLLQVFAAVRKEFPAARLIRVGGLFTWQQQQLVDRLDLERSIVVLPHLERNLLAAVYRRAALVMLPSEREGFGLPVIEALACGTAVVASDLPVLHEVGGESVRYCAVEDISSWTETVLESLLERKEQAEAWRDRRNAGMVQAGKYSWAEYASNMAMLYQKLL